MLLPAVASSPPFPSSLPADSARLDTVLPVVAIVHKAHNYHSNGLSFPRNGLGTRERRVRRVRYKSIASLCVSEPDGSVVTSSLLLAIAQSFRILLGFMYPLIMNELDDQSTTPQNAFLYTINFSEIAMEISVFLDLFSFHSLLQSSKSVKAVCDCPLAWRHYTIQYEAERSNKLRPIRRKKKVDKLQHISIFKVNLIRIIPQVIEVRGQKLIQLLQNAYEETFYSELYMKWLLLIQTAVRNKMLVATDAQQRCSHPTIGMLLNKTNYTTSLSTTHREYRLHVKCSECDNVCHESCYVCCCCSSSSPHDITVGCVECVNLSTFFFRRIGRSLLLRSALYCIV